MRKQGANASLLTCLLQDTESVESVAGSAWGHSFHTSREQCERFSTFHSLAICKSVETANSRKHPVLDGASLLWPLIGRFGMWVPAST